MNNLERKLSMSQCELHTTKGQLVEKTNSLNQANQKILELEKNFKMEYTSSPEHKVYIAKKNDLIDICLAKYLNELPDRRKLVVSFIRQEEGVYLFGTRRIFIKIEKGNLYVRVGGGFIPISTFID